MRQNITIGISPAESQNSDSIKKYIAGHLAVPEPLITGYFIVKRSIDARSRQPSILLSLDVFVDEPFAQRVPERFTYPDISRSEKKVIVAGAGPAGLFAALRLIELGIKPIILERGKDVRARRRDLATLNKEGIIDGNSNYCFGEGGAGTYSDGKLYTRSKKRGDVNRILNILVQFGADARILYDAHPHIGTNKLPQIISAIRQQITDSGGQIFFEKKIVDFIVSNNQLTGVRTSDNERINIDSLILATGHSARDIFSLLHQKNMLIEAKPFALGVRVEHPQTLIDSIQYHQPIRDEFLPPASYSLVQQVEGRGVFSFCMCPGGIIAPAATAPGEIVVNGWSPSKRDNPFANSGMVVTVEEKNIQHLSAQYGPLAAMAFQQSVEEKSFRAGGGRLVAPAQRLVDFTQNKLSSSLPACSYLPGVRSAPINEVLPAFVNESLREAFNAFGKKMKGYLTNEALVVATESRTSSPVRIPRDPLSLEHPQVKGLYPCGEGAGYAGGIVSAAMDGEKVAAMIKLRSHA